MSMSSVAWPIPRRARPDARLMAMVLLPHPPLALMTVMMFIVLSWWIKPGREAGVWSVLTPGILVPGSAGGAQSCSMAMRSIPRRFDLILRRPIHPICRSIRSEGYRDTIAPAARSSNPSALSFSKAATTFSCCLRVLFVSVICMPLTLSVWFAASLFGVLPLTFLVWSPAA